MFYDYHTHSSFSDDSPTPLRDMIDEAVNRGVIEIAVTDHFDPGYPDPEFPFELDFDKYQKTLEQYEFIYADKIKIIKGLEIGIQHDQLKECTKIVNDYEYDYIIGSFHCADGEPLYNGHFFDRKSGKEAFLDYYRYLFDSITQYNEFCNLGHMNIVERYCEAPHPEFNVYSDICEAILKHLIENGKGIELNTSSFRYNMKDSCPSRNILTLYRSLGGEIISMGSDAHTPDVIADHFEVSIEYLKSLGFKYITTFKKLNPKFIKL